jgi:3alpha(or 20beta)-hydroxysteroid dehydrogenase
VNDFHGKVAVITGAADGIGAATARHFIARGGRALLCDVQTDKVRALTGELGDVAAGFTLDVAVADQWAAAVAKAKSQFGKLTTLFNIAGISEPGDIETLDLESWDRTLAVNLSGPAYGCKYAIPAMAASGEAGAIVNVGSMLALRASAGFAAYAASKAGLASLGRSVALHCAAKGYAIRVNTVHPGGIRTPMVERYLQTDPALEAVFAASHPMGRIGEADEVVSAILFLASDAASFITGTDLPVDGGGQIRE